MMFALKMFALKMFVLKVFDIKKLFFAVFVLYLSFSICFAEEIDVFKLAAKGTPEELQNALKHGAKFHVEQIISDFDKFSEVEGDYLFSV